MQSDFFPPGKPPPFVVSVDAAVATIVRAADARDAVCTFPTPIVAGMRAAQLLPRPLYEFVATRSRVKY